MTQWMRGAAQLLRRRGTAPLMLVKSAAAVDRGSLRRGSTIVGDRSTRASSTQAVSMLPAEQWKVVYRAFLLHVHPDFFHHQPEQRAINERNLKTFQQHLQQLEHTRGQTAVAAAAAYQQQRGRGALASGSARLVFFLKPGMAHKDPPSTIHDDDADNGHSNNSSSSSSSNGNIRKISNSNIGNQSNKSSGLARKLILPLESHRTMATLLHEAGITSTHIPPPPGRAQPPTATGSHSSNRKDDGSEWEDWTEDLFGRAAASRARDEAESRDRRSRRYAASDNVEGAFGEGRQKTTEWGAASEEFEYRGHDASRLGYVLATDAGKTMVRERRSSALNVRELVGQLQGQYGFGDFTFRCGWSMSNLYVALKSLLETCDAHRHVFQVPDFRGMEVVFRKDPSELHKGEIRLCPADVPLEWISVLQSVTPAILSSVEKRAREVLAREKEASLILRGARLRRGLSCSKTRYFDFLGDVCLAGAEVVGEASSTDLLEGDWSVLECKVEEGFARVSKVLEDGTIQIGSSMPLGILRHCLGRDFASSSAVAAESARLAAAAATAADRCRRSLGLDNIERARTVSFAQMGVACEALTRLGESDSEGMEPDVVAARRRLRGHCVRVVGSRLGVFDGLTEDGEIAIPWNWAGEGTLEASEGGGFPAPFR